MKVSMIVLACVLGVFSAFFAGFVASGLMEKHATAESTAQRLKQFDALPLCAGKDPAQRFLETGGTCRPI